MAAVQEPEREIQKSYWFEHTADLTVESMMLDSKASDLDKEERPEVLSLLPPFDGKSVLELGAGIGRFTGELAKRAGELVAIDFIESAINKSNLKNLNSESIHDNTKCKLLHWCGNGVVAEGRVASTDPKAKVHHIPLGGSCWKVWVDKVLVKKVDLIRPNDEMLYLDDAIGSTVAWLSKLIVLFD